jgi:hypothetical protein
MADISLEKVLDDDGGERFALTFPDWEGQKEHPCILFMKQLTDLDEAGVRHALRTLGLETARAAFAEQQVQQGREMP